MDYMGTSVLMTRLSKLDIELKDEWHVETKYESDTPMLYALWFLTRPSTIFQLFRGRQFYWWRKLEYPKKTTDMSQVTDTLYRIRSR
jgi:hypothetical protein